MKKKIIIISVVLIGVMAALTSNSWAKRERGGDGRPDRGGRLEDFNRSENHNFDRDRVRDRHPHNYTRRDFKGPEPSFKHNFYKGNPHRPAYRPGSEFHRRHHYRSPYWHGPKFRHWRHRPVLRHEHPGRFYRRPHHSMVKEINHYYSSAESYSEPEDEFTASATITDTGFSVSVGVKETN